MTAPPDDRRRRLRMENILAGLLRYGALFACAWIVLGMALGTFSGALPFLRPALADRCMAIGVVLLIALPVLRVALTTAIFLFERDRLFAAISGAVLIIIALGFVLGTMKPHARLH